MKSLIAREKFENEKNKKGFDPHLCNLLGMNIYFVIKKLYCCEIRILCDRIFKHHEKIKIN